MSADLFTGSDADTVSKLCFEFYEKQLGKNGKPTSSEWTILASILVHFTNISRESQKKFKILSLATGSKCLPMKDLPIDGSLIHDSHAEVLARRGFIRYLYNEMTKSKNDKNYKSDVIERDLKSESLKFNVKNNLKFYLFCSHTPCGDASIIPKTENASEENDDNDDDDEFVGAPPIKKHKNDDDIHRTGAKCVPNSSLQDKKEKGVNYHIPKALRTKPGRGDPTISLSCSDKIAKWLVVGIQGALLTNFLNTPIYLDGIVISKCPYNQESMQRALIERSADVKNLPEGYHCHKPFIIQSSLVFKESKNEKIKTIKIDKEKFNACPTSICWSNIEQKPIIVLVRGNLLGATNRKPNKIRPLICKYKFFEQFSDLYKNTATTDDELDYHQVKLLNKTYNAAMTAFLEVYSDWLRTEPDKYYKFKLENKNNAIYK